MLMVLGSNGLEPAVEPQFEGLCAVDIGRQGVHLITQIQQQGVKLITHNYKADSMCEDRLFTLIDHHRHILRPFNKAGMP